MDTDTASQTSEQLDINSESETTDNIDGKTHLTNKETRSIVTPYAFFVADDLLGTSLAGPFSRGFALLVDLFLVSLLTQISSLILAAVAAWTFFRAGNRLKTKKRFNAARIFLRLLVALLLFVVAVGIVDSVNDDNSSDKGSQSASVKSDNIVEGLELVALTAKYLLETKEVIQEISLGECQPAYDCIKDLGEDLIQDVVATGLDGNAMAGVINGYVDSVSESISNDEKRQLQVYLQQFAETEMVDESDDQIISAQSQDAISKYSNDKIENHDPKGLLDWLEGLAEDLGLGLSWAALYFSIFTAWWKGQTPGKKLMGIKVVKLDNTALNLWESFGRYGGYAAGLATGLLGFLQVFWDPNRQAIQDKISETLVIDLRKPKAPFVKEAMDSNYGE